MTSIGKIIVLIITILNIFLLAISAATLATKKDWKGEIAKVNNQAKTAQDETDRLKKEADLRQASLQKYVGQRQSQETKYQKDIETIDQETSKLLKDNAGSRTTVFDLRKKADASLSESKALADQVMTLRGEIASFQEQKDAFDRQNQELQDQILNLDRQIGVAKTHRGDLGGGERVAIVPGANP